jgi:hypothetical protein
VIAMAVTDLEIFSAPEIKGSKCRQCGSTLERLLSGRWCDFCCNLQGDKMTIDSLLEEFDRLSLEGTLIRSSEAHSLLQDMLDDAYNNGYDEGFSNDDCGDSEW